MWYVCYVMFVCTGNIGYISFWEVHISATPIGYHIELFSDHYFILTNEDSVFVHMNEVSV